MDVGNIVLLLEGKAVFTASQLGNTLLAFSDAYDNMLKAQFDSLDISLAIDFSYTELNRLTLKPVNTININVINNINDTFFKQVAIKEKNDSIKSFIQRILDILKDDQEISIIFCQENMYKKISFTKEGISFVEEIPVQKEPQTYKTREEALEQYNIDKENAFRYAIIENIDLSGVDLSFSNCQGASFYKSNLANSRLNNVNLSDADLSETWLTNAILEMTDLSRADLSHVDLNQTMINNCTFYETDLSNSSLENAVFSDVNLASADFSGTKLTKCTFKGSIKFDADTDFSAKATWKEATIEDKSFLEFLQNNYDY